MNFSDPFGLTPCQENPAACALAVRVAFAANPLLGLAAVAGLGGAVVLSQPSVQEGAVEFAVAAREGLTQVVNSVRSTLRNIGNAIAVSVGIGTGDQVPQIEQEPPPPPGKNAPPPPGTGKSPIEIGRDGIPRMKIPFDP